MRFHPQHNGKTVGNTNSTKPKFFKKYDFYQSICLFLTKFARKTFRQKRSALMDFTNDVS